MALALGQCGPIILVLVIFPLEILLLSKNYFYADRPSDLLRYNVHLFISIFLANYLLGLMYLMWICSDGVGEMLGKYIVGIDCLLLLIIMIIQFFCKRKTYRKEAYR